MKKVNNFDAFVEKMMVELSQIKNINLVNEDGKANKIFFFVVRRYSEIHTFKQLFLNYYLPAASKSVVEGTNDIRNSKYKHLINISKEDLKENFYETVRLGYVGMFHKYENYIDDLIRHAELLIEELEEDKPQSIPLTKYAETTFNYKIKDWKNSKIINRLNWINNCIKHYDGYPRKTPKPTEYEHYSEESKLTFSKEDLQRDLEFLINEYLVQLKVVFLIALHKSSDIIGGIDPEVEGSNKVIIAKQKMTEAIHNMITLFKSY